MFTILTCDGYTAEETAETLTGAIAACLRRERESGDTFARVVSHNGQLVADSEGAWRPRSMSTYERQEACFGEQP